LTGKHQPLTVVPSILLAVSLIYVGILGVISTDFGRHWDEPRIIKSVANSVETGLLLPRWYNYPSLSYDIALITSIPQAILNALWAESGLKRDKVMEYLLSPSFKFHLRSVFFLLSICSGLAIYFFVRSLSGSAWIGLFGALALISSWEFIYHARWIAPDAILAFLISCSLASQYHILTTKCHRQRFFWIVISAALAGLCIGTKYTGGIVFVPLLFAIGLAHKTEPHRSSTTLLAVTSILIAGVIFLVTTPGSILEPEKFLRHVLFEIKHYSTGHRGYTVAAGLDHLYKMLTYLFLVTPSKNAAAAVTASTLALIGIVFVVRTQPRYAVWLLSVPILYICYMSLQSVMFARNYLLLLPYLSVLTSLGLFALTRGARNKYPLWFLILGFSIFFLFYNLSIATRSSLSIFSRSAPPPRVALERHIAASPETIFYLSPASCDLFEVGSTERYTNVTSRIETSDRLIFLSSEVANSTLYKANVPGRYRTVWSQTEEVNWDYYPSWAGNHRILEISPTDRELKALIEEVIPTKGSTGR